MSFRPDYTDQAAFFNPVTFGHALIFIGCGGAGGTALPTLGTLGMPRIELWDGDTVEQRNLAATTLYGPDDVGRPKVAAAGRELRRLGVPDVVEHHEAFDPEQHADLLDGIVVSALDSMAMRQQLWEVIRGNGLVPLYLDGRIGGEVCHLNVVRPCDPGDPEEGRISDAEWYEEHQLFGDDKTAPLPCGQRNVVYPSAILGGVIASRLASFSRGESVKRHITIHTGTMEVVQY